MVAQAQRDLETGPTCGLRCILALGILVEDLGPADTTRLVTSLKNKNSMQKAKKC